VRAVWALAWVASLGAPRAWASLRDDAEQIRTGWTRWGAASERLTPVFAFEGAAREIAVPAPRPGEARCRSIVGVAERNIRFALVPSEFVRVPPVEPSDAEAPEAPARREPSTAAGQGEAGEAASSRAGVAVLRDCEPGARLARVRLVMSSPRAAVELLVVHHDGALPPVGLIAPERVQGPGAHADWSAEPLHPEPLAARLARAEEATRLDGASLTVRVQTEASARGEGVVALKLPPGCHRIGVLGAEPSNPAAPFDVDAEARTADGQQLLARDRSTAPDALLELCAGEAEVVQVRYGGAPSHGAVTVLDALWPLPAGIDPLWSPEVRAGLGWAVARRGAPAPRTAATLQVLGGQGATRVPVPVEPGGCYLAAVALRRGPATATRLSASAGDRTVVDQATSWPYAAAVSFCAKDVERALLTVEVRSSLAWWQLELWRLGGGAP
jgi:hypothetical protein